MDSAPSPTKFGNKEHTTTFLTFFRGKYWERTDSIFMGALVGGLFLSYLLDNDTTCDDRDFTKLYFVIGLSHYISNTLKNMRDYSSHVATFDNEISKLEVWIGVILAYAQHFIKLAQFPMVIALGVYLTQLAIKYTAGELTTMPGDTCRCLLVGASNSTARTCHNYCEFCQSSTITLGWITFAFQSIYGVLVLISWFTMWYVDDADDEKEEKEQAEWKAKEAAMKGTVLGNVKEFLLTIGMRPFFDENISGTMLSISLALPMDACNMGVMRWFLAAGVTHILNAIIEDVRSRITDMAADDGIINKVENRILTFLSLLNFPLFLGDLTIFVYISDVFWSDFGHVDFEDKDSESYCAEGVWHLTSAIFFIYSTLFLFRVFVIMGSFMPGKAIPPEIDEDAKTSQSEEDPDTILEEIIEEGGSENSADQYDGPPKGDRRFLDTLWDRKKPKV